MIYIFLSILSYLIETFLIKIKTLDYAKKLISSQFNMMQSFLSVNSHKWHNIQINCLSKVNSIKKKIE